MHAALLATLEPVDVRVIEIGYIGAVTNVQKEDAPLRKSRKKELKAAGNGTAACRTACASGCTPQAWLEIVPSATCTIKQKVETYETDPSTDDKPQPFARRGGGVALRVR